MSVGLIDGARTDRRISVSIDKGDIGMGLVNTLYNAFYCIVQKPFPSIGHGANL